MKLDDNFMKNKLYRLDCWANGPNLRGQTKRFENIVEKRDALEEDASMRQIFDPINGTFDFSKKRVRQCPKLICKSPQGAGSREGDVYQPQEKQVQKCTTN